MALGNAPEGGGDFLGSADFLAWGKEGALLAFRTLRIEDPRRMSDKYEKEAEPVVVDMVVVSGARKGEVFRSERVINAGITNTIRKTDVGADTAVRMVVIKGKRDFGGANPCSSLEYAEVGKFFEEAKSAGFTFENGDPDPYSWAEKVNEKAGGTAAAAGDDEPPW